MHYYIRKVEFFLLNLGKKFNRSKLIAKHAKKAESKALSLVRYAIVEKTKAAYSNPFPAV